MWKGRGGGGTPPPAYGYFASPTGSDTGAGTVGDPWDLYTALKGGYPAATVQPGDTVWLRGGTYTTTMTTANMAGTTITKVVPVPGSRYITSSTLPWVVGDIGKNITVYGAGVSGADIVTTITAFVDSRSVQIGTAATYGTQWHTSLVGTQANPITFRGYPGERVTLDGNYDSNDLGNLIATFTFRSPGRYLIVRDIEITNSNTDRHVGPGGSADDFRGDCFEVSTRDCKIINCILHDDGEGMFVGGNGDAAQIYGNLVYHNGCFQPQGEANCEAAIDIPPAGGSAVAKSGTYTFGAATGSPLTFSHNNVAGDFLVVVAGCTGASAYTNLSATYNGVAMTRITGNKTVSTSPVAIFALANPATGSNNVVVTCSDGARVTAIAQSFVNADQTIGNTVAAGTPWGYVEFLLPPFTNTVSSAANHMIVDGMFILNVYAELGTYAAAGDATLIYAPSGGSSGNPATAMTYASGAASVDMGFTWTPITVGAGHGVYTQSSKTIDTIEVVASDNTVTCHSAPFVAADVGCTMIIEGAGVAGGIYTGTITTFNSTSSIEVDPAPSTSIDPARGKWGHGQFFKDNIFLDQAAYTFQAYGGSDAAFVESEVTGNLFAGVRTFMGGLTAFELTNTVYHNNYHWLSALNIGYHMQHMTNFDVHSNYVHDGVGVVDQAYWENLTIGSPGNENTFIGPTPSFSGDFTDNYYYTLGSPPATNLVVIRDNDYEANRANIYVYNWENLTDVDVDLSSVVANGTAIHIMNAQDYYATPVYSGTYSGGTVSLPMTGLTVAAVIGHSSTEYVEGHSCSTTFGPAFAAFIVRAQSEETWR